MGQQYNKIENRRRRRNYLERLKEKAKAGSPTARKAVKKPAKKKGA